MSFIVSIKNAPLEKVNIKNDIFPKSSPLIKSLSKLIAFIIVKIRIGIIVAGNFLSDFFNIWVKLYSLSFILLQQY